MTGESRVGYVCTYTYDGNGNRLTKTLNGVTETYAYDAGDKLLTRSGLTGSYAYTYDANGNTKTVTQGSNLTTLNYDIEDRVTSIVGPGLSTSYTYNGLSTRTSKSGTGGTRTYKRDGAGVTAPVLADGVATMVPGISERSSGVTRLTHFDQLGTASKMTNAAQTVTTTRMFDAFGLAIATTNPSGSQKGFAAAWGYQEDDETGLKLLGHRLYDPGSGRFLTRDPIGAGSNWFAYCYNNPIRFVDPKGLDRHDPTRARVDPRFKGRVWAMGEVEDGGPQVMVELKPGYETDHEMDVDYLIIEDGSGKRSVYFLPGVTRYSPGTDVQTYTVGEDGNVWTNRFENSRVAWWGWEAKRLPNFAFITDLETGFIWGLFHKLEQEARKSKFPPKFSPHRYKVGTQRDRS